MRLLEQGRKDDKDTRLTFLPYVRLASCSRQRRCRRVPERRLLDTTELFTALPADVLDDLRKRAANRTYDRNELLFTQGDIAGELFVIEEGRIAIATKAPDGRESVLAVLERGAMFGELPLFDGSPRSADARALTESRVIVLEYDPVREVLQARSEERRVGKEC